MSSLIEMGQRAKDAAVVLATLSTPAKNKALLASADALLAAKAEILAKNKADVDAAVEAGIKGAFIDRLTLTEARLADMAEGLRQVAKLDDPVGEVLSMKTLDNGLVIGQKRVPMGVIGIIFEARPNVAADAFGLCLKAGSAVILRGGKEAFQTNQAVISALRGALAAEGLPEDCVQMVPDTSRETANEMMRLNGYLDVLIPRGGAGLIQAVMQNATVPVIETGTGVCHVYVDKECRDLDKAVSVTYNAKMRRVSVCNAMETLLVHKDIAEVFLPRMLEKFRDEAKVEIRGCEHVREICPWAKEATEEDWPTEYDDYILSVKVVDSLRQAIDHINTYGTRHSESILTDDVRRAQEFLDRVDAAAVYLNAPTSFTDGGEFGFGAEIGISNQKLHARGPMGPEQLTTIKYQIFGDGQIRNS